MRKELLPQARSARATGSWTPDSRIALANAAGPEFAALWEQMARTSLKTYRSYLGLPGNPVDFDDRYYPVRRFPSPSCANKWRRRTRWALPAIPSRIADITPRPQSLPPGTNALSRCKYVSRSTALQFNIPDYGHTAAE